MPVHRTWVELDERALVSNLNVLRSLLAPGARFCAVVKANAYGHGLRETVQSLARNGVDAFAVDSLDDALLLRSLLPSAVILVSGYVVRERLAEAVRAGVSLTVYDKETVRALDACAGADVRTAAVHVKVETGTNRQGVLPEGLADLLETIRACPRVSLEGVSTHFANIEDPADTRFATLQLSRFQEALNAVHAAGFTPPFVHCACSAALILYPDTHFSLVRAGISLYGHWSAPETQLAAIKHMVKCDLSPVLSWKTRVAQVKQVPAGVSVGYGLSETTRRPTRLAILPVGYWDGYDRSLSSVGEVLIAGNRCKVMGRVCMNMLMVDASAVPNLQPEQEAVLIGRGGRHHVTAEELAARTGTIAYEVLSRINPTLPRIVV